MVKYKVGHYYKRTWKGHKFIFIFKVVDIYERRDWLFITVIRDEDCANTKQVDLVIPTDESNSRTIELTELEKTTILL